MCDLTIEDLDGNAGNPEDCTDSIVRRGDLLVCTYHTKEFGLAWNVGRVPGEVRCSCGYFRPSGQPCGEPCL